MKKRHLQKHSPRLKVNGVLYYKLTHYICRASLKVSIADLCLRRSYNNSELMTGELYRKEY